MFALRATVNAIISVNAVNKLNLLTKDKLINELKHIFQIVYKTIPHLHQIFEIVLIVQKTKTQLKNYFINL